MTEIDIKTILDPDDEILGATETKIKEVQLFLKCKLPDLYRKLLLHQDGGIPYLDGVLIEYDDGSKSVESIDQFLSTEDFKNNDWIDSEGLLKSKNLVPFTVTGHVSYCFNYNKLNSCGEPTITRIDFELDDPVNQVTPYFQSCYEFFKALDEVTF